MYQKQQRCQRRAGSPDLAARLRAAIGATLHADQVRTGDLGGKASTGEFTRALVARMRRG